MDRRYHTQGAKKVSTWCGVKKIVSGGQTGVDRAALDIALGHGIPCGGCWCPKGRRAEDGPIGTMYPLKETETNQYSERTRRNVSDSDGTLIVCDGKPKDGTALTISFAKEVGMPLFVVDVNRSYDLNKIRRWLESNNILTLNVAGPRESTSPGIHVVAKRLMRELLSVEDIS